MDKLHSWSDDKATQNYSGSPTIQRFTVPPKLLAPGITVSLTLGEAKPINAKRETPQAPVTRPISIAGARSRHRPRQRGEQAGSVWFPHIQSTSRPLKPGENQIRIEVANTQINALAAKLPQLRLQSGL